AREEGSRVGGLVVDLLQGAGRLPLPNNTALLLDGRDESSEVAQVRLVIRIAGTVRCRIGQLFRCMYQSRRQFGSGFALVVQRTQQTVVPVQNRREADDYRPCTPLDLLLRPFLVVFA